MLLTQEEWEDLAHMLHHYRMCTAWADGTCTALTSEEITRRRRLADRIIDAAEVEHA